MNTHIVAWNFKDEVKPEDKERLKSNMKKNLEGLVGKVPGLLTATFYSEPMEGSNREMCLITTHQNKEDIAIYGTHPAHVEVANTFVRPYTKDRTCINL